MERATTRLRRTFAYPHDSSDSDSDGDAPAAPDEQEQESLIAALAAQNDARNAQFRLLLLCLPAVSSLPYLITLLFPKNDEGEGAGGRLTALLSLSSLACTGWVLATLPPGVTGVRVLDAWVGGSGNGSESKKRKQRSSDALSYWAEGRPRSPLETYLPYLNAGLCAVLVLAGFVSKSAVSQGHWGHVGLSNLPAIVYGVVLVAKMVMGGVDPERDLGALRYEYKGA
ncbi:hypothetical protein F4819DRAFT_484388 [Hypoxylon fuscum]|nr:hypothetical protein F4819DRAFT_484388 [Hypoxylon fuscum]